MATETASTGRTPTGQGAPQGAPISPPAPPPPPFSFTVSSIDVIKPRSLFNDTDSAVLTINAMAADNSLVKQYGPITRSLGNHGDNSTFDPQMSLTGIVLPEGGSLAVSFVVVNKGDWEGDLSSGAVEALELAGAAVLGALAQGQVAQPKMPSPTPITDPSGQQQIGTLQGESTTASVPLYWAIAIATGIIVVLEGINILFADCDGTVVPGAFSLGQTELLSNAIPGPWELTLRYPGTDSPTGCGPNSDYVVTYSVIGGGVAVPSVVDLPEKEAAAALTAAGLTFTETFVPVGGDEYLVITQSPPGGTMVPVSSTVQIEVGEPGGGSGGGGGGGGNRHPQ
jgi:hypothetical protein